MIAVIILFFSKTVLGRYFLLLFNVKIAYYRIPVLNATALLFTIQYNMERHIDVSGCYHTETTFVGADTDWVILHIPLCMQRKIMFLAHLNFASVGEGKDNLSHVSYLQT